MDHESIWLANKSVLSQLDTIQSSALRLTLGAFRTSPKLSLCAEAAEPPLFFRRLILTSNFLSSLSQSPHLPIFDPIFHMLASQSFPHPLKHIRHQFEISLSLSMNPFYQDLYKLFACLPLLGPFSN